MTCSLLSFCLASHLPPPPFLLLFVFFLCPFLIYICFNIQFSWRVPHAAFSWVRRNLFWQLSRDGNLNGSGMSHATAVSPNPFFRAPWSVGCTVVSRGNNRWTTSKSGHICPCQNCSERPPAEKTGRWYLLNRPSCPPGRPNRSRDWPGLNLDYSAHLYCAASVCFHATDRQASCFRKVDMTFSICAMILAHAVHTDESIQTYWLGRTEEKKSLQPVLTRSRSHGKAGVTGLQAHRSQHWALAPVSYRPEAVR